jgi:H+-transporting ATPase
LPDFSQRVAYHSFNSLAKRWEAIYETDGQVLRVMKGFPNVLFQLAGSDNGLEHEAARLTSLGYQVLAVAVGDDSHMQIAGLIALKDPLRADIQTTMSQLQELGIKLAMITGSALRAAQAVAHQIGISDKAYPMQSLPHLVHPLDVDCNDVDSATFAEALPEDKVKLVEMYRQAHCVVGITGNGIDDIQAIRQADVGIATLNATPAAQAAAGVVLTKPGLSGIIAFIQTSHQVSQQILAYSLTTLIMSLVTALFISLEWILTGNLVTTAHLLILILLANSLLKMTILPASTTAAGRRVHISDQSFAWLTLSLAVPALILCYAVFWTGKIVFRLPLTALQTLVFILLVSLGQGIYYLLRERGHAWGHITNKKVLIARLAIILGAVVLASIGILVHPIPLTLIFGLLGIVVLSLLGLDFLKINLFRWLEI